MVWRVLTFRTMLNEATSMRKFVLCFKQEFGTPYSFEAFIRVRLKALACRIWGGVSNWQAFIIAAGYLWLWATRSLARSGAVSGVQAAAPGSGRAESPMAPRRCTWQQLLQSLPVALAVPCANRQGQARLSAGFHQFPFRLSRPSRSLDRASDKLQEVCKPGRGLRLV